MSLIRLTKFFTSVKRFHRFAQASAKSTEIVHFQDSKSIYQFKSTWELVRSLGILKICSINYFAENSLDLMRRAEKIFGNRILRSVIRPTFYKQFVGGESESELIATAQLLSMSNLRLMVCPVQEEDIGEGSGSETKYDTNKKYILETAKIMANTRTPIPNLQLKITAFMPADLVANLSKCLIEKSTSLDSVVLVISTLFESPSSVNAKISQLSDLENQQLKRGVARIRELGDFAKASNMKLLVDGEYTYMNPGISAIALGMMMHYNKDMPIVANTYQCYLKATLKAIQEQKSLMDHNKRLFAAKIVRGAYMEKERKLAQSSGHPDPINETYEDTGRMYNQVIDFLLNEAVTGSDMYVVVATHNEGGVRHAVKGLQDRGISSQSGKFVFGQIYGMGEQMSMPLANSGFIVYKSVPYGPLSEVLPYLSRRAAENRAVILGARRERELLVEELRRRLTPF